VREQRETKVRVALEKFLASSERIWEGESSKARQKKSMGGTEKTMVKNLNEQEASRKNTRGRRKIV